uniref:DC1 domain-containing protein n=1 Tax=Oryza rufipogon TaxID=4529 RepID=A0A0E0QGE3_ORYRU
MAAAADNLPAEVPHQAHPRSGSGCTLLVLHRHGDTATNFVCDGCREPGEGTRYTSGDLVLHTHCALAAPTLRHPPAVTPSSATPATAPCAGAGSTTTAPPAAWTCTRAAPRCRCPSRCRRAAPPPSSSKNTDQRMYLHVKCIKEIMAGLGHGGGGGGNNGEGCSKMHHHEIMAAGSCRGGADAGGEGADRVNRVIARLQERAGGGAGGGGSSKSKLVRRVCEVLVMLMRVVIGVLLGDPTVPLIAFNFIMP